MENIVNQLLQKIDKVSDKVDDIKGNQIGMGDDLKYMGTKVAETVEKLDEHIEKEDKRDDTIDDMSKEIKQITSWKNGLQLFINKTNGEAIENLKKFAPLQEDLAKRLEISSSWKGRWSSLKWDIIKTIGKALFYALVFYAMFAASSKDFWSIVIRFLH
jgi:predicted small metal-binding protein